MTRTPRSLALLVLLAAAPSALPAQGGPSRAPRRPSAAAVSRAALTITEADFRARLGALAHDSMRGRETPSPELAKAADWLAIQFRQAGLRPAGDTGGWLQRFQLRHTRQDSLTTFALSRSGTTARWSLGREIGAIVGTQPTEPRDVPVVLVAGAPADSARPFGDVPVRGALVLLAIPFDQNRNIIANSVYSHAASERARAVVWLSEWPAERFAQNLRRFVLDQWTLAESAAAGDDGTGWFVVQLPSAAELLRAAGEDAAMVLSPERRGVRALGPMTFSLSAHESVIEEPTVANVVGVVEGSDPTLRGEAVVFTAHYDHVGVVGGRCQPSAAVPGDSVCNGADDNASGTVGIIEVARAFAALRPHPARTIVFAAVAAEERGLFGARYYLNHPVVPVERTAAVLNLDMIARNGRDTVGFVGRNYSSLGAVVDSALLAHPELRLAAAEHQGLYPNSDHYPFALRGVPALFFFSGVYDDLHTAADNLDRADPAQATRIARLAFHVGLQVANAAGRPVWDPQARARLAGQ